jgi:undecaprenyl pyrophosphate phosphatase UppP
VKNRALVIGVVVAVLTIWLVGTAVTKYSLEQMAFFAPIAVCVIGATVAVVMLWVKVVLQLRRERRERRAA